MASLSKELDYFGTSTMVFFNKLRGGVSHKAQKFWTPSTANLEHIASQFWFSIAVSMPPLLKKSTPSQGHFLLITLSSPFLYFEPRLSLVSSAE